MRLPKLLSKMECDWDARARENFRYYIVITELLKNDTLFEWLPGPAAAK